MQTLIVMIIVAHRQTQRREVGHLVWCDATEVLERQIERGGKRELFELRAAQQRVEHDRWQPRGEYESAERRFVADKDA